MDLLFKRYASPFLFLDGYISTCRFCEFIGEFAKTVVAEKEEAVNWDFYLHKVQEGTFKDFVDELKTNKENAEMSKADMEATVQESMNILKNFNPTEGGE